MTALDPNQHRPPEVQEDGSYGPPPTLAGFGMGLKNVRLFNLNVGILVDPIPGVVSLLIMSIALGLVRATGLSDIPVYGVLAPLWLPAAGILMAIMTILYFTAAHRARHGQPRDESPEEQVDADE